MSLIVLVTGGRDYADIRRVFLELDRLHRGPDGPIATLWHGAARGADSLAAQWARDAGVALEPRPADWIKYGKPAGIIRNAAMLSEARAAGLDLVIVFPGDRGTADMRRRSLNAGIKTLIIDPFIQYADNGAGDGSAELAAEMQPFAAEQERDEHDDHDQREDHPDHP